MPLKFRERVRGYVMIMVAFLIPLILAAVNYGIKRVQVSHRSTVKRSAAHAVAQAVLDKYNPAKTWSAQQKMMYSAAAQALNDRAFDLDKDLQLAPPTTIPVYSSSGTVVSSGSLVQMYRNFSSYELKSSTTNISKHSTYGSLVCDEDPLANVVFNPSTGQISHTRFSFSGSGTAHHNAIYYNPDAVATVKKTSSSNQSRRWCLDVWKRHMFQWRWRPECDSLNKPA
jgi:hypothetical protein